MARRCVKQNGEAETETERNESGGQKSDQRHGTSEGKDSTAGSFVFVFVFVFVSFFFPSPPFLRALFRRRVLGSLERMQHRNVTVPAC